MDCAKKEMVVLVVLDYIGLTGNCALFTNPQLEDFWIFLLFTIHTAVLFPTVANIVLLF